MDIWRTFEPVVRDYLTSELGPAGALRRSQDAFGAVVRAALSAPELAERVDRLSKDLETALEDGVPLSEATTQTLGEYAAGRSAFKLAALWVGAGALVAIAVGVWS